jgi:hypothetical protein
MGSNVPAARRRDIEGWEVVCPILPQLLQSVIAPVGWRVGQAHGCEPMFDK